MRARYCFGGFCRGLTEVPSRRRLYCDACAPLMAAAYHRKAFHRYLKRNRAAHNARARRWYYANRERDLARRKAYAKEAA